MIKVSVIISAYNIENYICKCVNSIINQSFQEFEVIIVDDGSTDKTYKLLKEISGKNAKIKIISQKNCGVQKARQVGYNISKGEYVIFVDGDDWLEKNALELLYEKAKQEKADVIYYKYSYVTDNDKIKCDNREYNSDNENELLEQTLRGNVEPGICLKFIKRDFIEKYEITFLNNIGYGEDLALSVNLAIYKPRVGFLNEALYCYYKRSDSVTNKLTNQVFDIIQALNLIENYLIEFEYMEKYKELFNFLKYRHLYMNRVIDVSHKCNFHKEFSDIWKKQNININNNKEYLNYIHSQKLSKKFKCYLYNKEYRIGKIYSIIIERIK